MCLAQEHSNFLKHLLC